MAASTRTANASRRVTTSAGTRQVAGTVRPTVGGHTIEIIGLALAFAGIALLIALITYNPQDPSLNTASARETRNLAGPFGAIISDLLLQTFGGAAVLPGLVLLVWAWRLVSHRSLGSVAVRVATTLAAIPVVSAVLATMGPPANGAPQALSGPGGAAGRLMADAALHLGSRLLGPVGELLTWLAGVGLAVALTAMALGLTVQEWKTAGRAARRAANVTARGGRTGWRWMGGVSVAVPPVLSRSFAPPRLSTPGWIRRLWDRPAQPDQHEPPVFDEAPVPFVPPVEHHPEYDDPPAAPDAVPAGESLPVRISTPAAARPKPRPRLAGQGPTQMPLDLGVPGWRFPQLDLLTAPPRTTDLGPTREALEGNARLLIKVLGDYGVKGTIMDIRPGPVVTMYELEPEAGIRSARVIGLADDVARSLSVTAVRIATVPGRNVIGIEVPNAKRDTVYLSEILSSEEVRKNAGRLPLALGKNISGQAVVADLARMPHLMIAGTTGSGKSVGVNAMILSLLYRLSPDQCRLILIDPKMLELSIYDGIPHLLAPVVTEPAKAVTALKWVVREMERRYRAMSQLGVRNIGGYNERVEDARRKGEVVTRRVQTGFDSETGRPTFEDQPLALEPLAFIVVVVDEMADLMMVAGKEIEAAVQRLAQMARAAGIHVIMATQRPSVDVITGTIKANFPTRISFQVISKFDSRTILGEQGAEQLLGMGDMLFMQGGGRITRVHGPFVSDEEVEAVVAFLREQGEPVYLEEVTEPMDKEEESLLSGIAGASDGEKGLFDQAVDLVAREGKASTSFIQRHLNIGYNRAAKLIEQMEKEGIVGPANHVGKREVLTRRISKDDD
jgi:S-DNA-T family DNA segregation ATPase FtsK/SpoIIIE